MKYNLIKKYEGCILDAYKCPAGKWTIGYGTTFYPNGDHVRAEDKISEEQAIELLNWFVQQECYFVFEMDLTENQKEAVISLVYNIGKTAFLKSSLYRAILKKDYKKIAKNWDWYSAGGKVLKGLMKRRTEELALFMQDI